MSQGSLLSLMGAHSEPSSVTWTRSGLMLRGAAYQQPKLARTMAATASGSSRGGVMWPTPRYEDSQSVNQSLARRAAGMPPEHVESAARGLMGRLWSTPSAGNFNDSETPQSWRARADALKEKGINGNGAGIPLAIQAKETVGRLWSTPGATDHRGANPMDRQRPQGNRDLPTDARLWMTPGVGDNRGASKGWEAAAERHAVNGQHKQMMLRDQVVRFHVGPRSLTIQADGEVFLNGDPTSLQLNPLFDEWLLFGVEMIGWTCVCPARALVAGGSPPSATPSAPINAPPLSKSSGGVPSERTP